jgi:hypothetical protein
VDLLLNAANASTREHRHRHITGHIDSHRRKAAAATQAPNRLGTTASISATLSCRRS